MNNLTSLQRKLVYLGGIIVLLIPITYLGLPPEPGGDGKIASGSGGKLFQMRAKHALGESSYGRVDAASSTMNLLLLGFRGVATSMLWMDWQEQQKIKDWAALRGTTESIILLQPHFLKVWQFQGWNLAYNVSAEWDAVSDRYYWVKEGVKFYKQGLARNEKFGELPWYTGDLIGKKIGRSDEWQQFRRYFRKDPDAAKFPSGVDPDVNPDGKDNYLVARSWFEQANATVDRFLIEQHVMARILFRSYPVRAQIDYASVLQREGIFDEVTLLAWELAHNDWVTKYGREEFETPIGMIHLAPNEQEIAAMQEYDAEREDEQEKIGFWLARMLDMTNYNYWRTRTAVESEKSMAEANRELFEGQQLVHQGDHDTARELLESGMKKFQTMVESYPNIVDEDEMIEKAMLAIYHWKVCLETYDEKFDEDGGDYPLKSIWLKHREGRLKSIKEEFDRQARGIR